MSIPLTIVALVVCIFLAGAGHGTYTPAIILFPYGMLTTLSEHTIGPFSIFLVLIQFSTYGVVIDLTKGTKRARQIATFLLLLHSLTIAIVLINRGETF